MVITKQNPIFNFGEYIYWNFAFPVAGKALNFTERPSKIIMGGMGVIT